MNFSKTHFLKEFGSNYSSPELCQIIKQRWNVSFLDLPAFCRPKPYEQGPLICISIILTMLSIGTCIDNCLMISAVGMVKKLQTPCNMLILNLAVTDLLVGTLVIPFASIYQIKGYWIFSEIICDIFILFDVLLCTSSILNLCAISVDRYLVITQPFKYAVKRTRKRMLCMIMLVWTASALISIPPLFGWRQKREPYTCDYSNDLGYQIYATFIAFYLPLVVMLVLYGRIFRLASAMLAAEMKQKVNADCSDSITTNSRKGSIVDEGYDSQGRGKWESVSNFLKPISRRLSFRTPSEYCTPVTNIVFDESEFTLSKKVTDANKHHILGKGSRKVNPPPQCLPIIQIDSSDPTDDNHSVKPDQHKRRLSFLGLKPQKASVEAKAVRTLGIIMGCFTICWLPFFLMQILNPILKLLQIEYESYVGHVFFQIFYWLGYTNSFLNPLIYAKFNREFRRPFLQILMCHCRNINAHLRSETYNDQYGVTGSHQKLSQQRPSISYSALPPPPSPRSDRKNRNRLSATFINNCDCTDSNTIKGTQQTYLLLPYSV